MMARRLALSIAWVALSLLPGCISRNSGPIGGRVDSESHWLEACSLDAQCGALSCVCGVCTQTCGGAADCGGDALCVDPVGPWSVGPWSVGPGSVGPGCDAPLVCTAACVDRFDCPGAMRCAAGACVPLAEPAPTCLGDDDCAGGEVCRGGRCVPPEVCEAPADEDGDGFAGCADADCLSDPACPPDIAAAFEPSPEIVACGMDLTLPDGMPLADTAALDAAAIDGLRSLRDGLAASRAALAEAPVYMTPLDAALAALDAIIGRLGAARVEDCRAPDCAADALLTAELALLGELMDALDQLDPGNATLLPHIDCAMAAARVRLGRRAAHYQGLCPAAYAARGHGQWFDDGGWIEWAHDRALRVAVDCDVRRAYNECLPDQLGVEPIDRTLLCDPVTPE